MVCPTLARMLLLNRELRQLPEQVLTADKGRHTEVRIRAGWRIGRKIERDHVNPDSVGGVDGGNHRDIEAGNTQGDRVWRGSVIADDSRLIGVDENPGCRNRPA